MKNVFDELETTLPLVSSFVVEKRIGDVRDGEYYVDPDDKNTICYLERKLLNENIIICGYCARTDKQVGMYREGYMVLAQKS